MLPRSVRLAESYLRFSRCTALSHFSTSISEAPRLSTPLSGALKKDTFSLAETLKEGIKTNGPLTISQYTSMCLFHPTKGYYTNQNVFGSKGDFITSPEISQVFGELIGIWLTSQWLSHGEGAPVRIVELGPGRGTLLSDILRTFQLLPPHSRPPVQTIHLIEGSDKLKLQQSKVLEKWGFSGSNVQWCSSVDEVEGAPEAFTMFVAHEFFDALPVHIMEKTPKGWREVLVDINEPKVIVPNAKERDFRLVLAPNHTPTTLLYEELLKTNENYIPTVSSDIPSSAVGQVSPSSLKTAATLPQGSRIEISPASWEVAKGIGKLLECSKAGAGLIVDYGDYKAFGRSWRAFKNHRITDPLDLPGESDITANVDFASLASIILEEPSVSVHLPILNQRQFLNRMGLQHRVERLLAKASSEERKKDIESATKRLVDKIGMGTEYKFLGITKGISSECFPFVDGIEDD